MAKGSGSLFHLLEPMYDRRVELVLVGKVVLEIAAGCECL
jgi:hypothetical protein